MAETSPFLTVIIVNWNGIKVLPKCLSALEAQTYMDYEIILVDNASIDGSVENLEIENPKINLIRLSENKGFATANNIGARKARGRWLVLLNNDAFPDPKWLAALVAATEQFPDAAAFGSRMIRAENPGLLDGTGDVYHISGLAWRRHYNHPLEAAGNYADEIFSPNAAAAMYRRDVFLELGGFDESFGSYHEDVDLGFRLRLLGFACYYIPDAIVYHIGSASTGLKSDFAVYHGHRNLVWSYFQNMPGYLVLKYLPAHLLAMMIYLIYYTIMGKTKAIWRAKFDGFLELPRVLEKRKKIQAIRKVDGKEIDRVLNHQWLEPYQLGFKARQTQK
jgi:GT2 family glycosyltransferase